VQMWYRSFDPILITDAWYWAGVGIWSDTAGNMCVEAGLKAHYFTYLGIWEMYYYLTTWEGGFHENYVHGYWKFSYTAGKLLQVTMWQDSPFSRTWHIHYVQTDAGLDTTINYTFAFGHDWGQGGEEFLTSFESFTEPCAGQNGLVVQRTSDVRVWEFDEATAMYQLVNRTDSGYYQNTFQAVQSKWEPNHLETFNSTITH
jgi:hypothetical protein